MAPPQLIWPLPNHHALASGFHDPRPWGLHAAIDIPCPNGTPVHVVADGTVAAIGHLGQAGYRIEVSHPGGWHSRYLHLTPDSATIPAGAHVAAGQVIALSDNTGYTTGPHLHLAIWTTDEAQAKAVTPDAHWIDWARQWAVDPERLFAAQTAPPPPPPPPPAPPAVDRAAIVNAIANNLNEAIVLLRGLL